jgi:colanic acid biosynthesis glycosyl transferase WcaI
MRLLIHDYAGHPFQVQLSRELARRGHNVLHTYAGALQTPRGELGKKPGDSTNFDSREVEMDPNYARFKYSFIKRRQMEIAYGKEMAVRISAWNPDIVLSSNTPTEPQAEIQKATQRVGGRFVMWHQDFYSIAVDKLVRKKIPVVGGLIGNYYRRMERRQLQSADHVVAITEDFVPIMKSDFGVLSDKVSVIPNWAPIETLPTRAKRNAWSERHGLADKFVFLYTGTLGMKHNPALLLQLAQRHASDAEVRVVVISEGIGAKWLEENTRTQGVANLKVLPYQSFSEMPEVLATGDVLVAVLEEDAGIFSVPSKVLTNLCAGRPQLLAVPLVNLAARIIAQNGAGLIVAPSDTEGFLTAGTQLRSDPTAAAAMGKRARAYAEATFDIDAIADRFESIFTTLHGGTGLAATSRESRQAVTV